MDFEWRMNLSTYSLHTQNNTMKVKFSLSTPRKHVQGVEV